MIFTWIVFIKQTKNNSRGKKKLTIFVTSYKTKEKPRLKKTKPTDEIAGNKQTKPKKGVVLSPPRGHAGCLLLLLTSKHRRTWLRNKKKTSGCSNRTQAAEEHSTWKKCKVHR